MLFNSYEFIFVFLPVTFSIYFYLNSKRLTVASKAWLIVSSLCFYSWWNIVYLPLILISVLINYSIATTMLEIDENKKKYFSKKFLLQIGLVFNIGLLVYFKYMDFFIENINSAFSTEIGLFHLALPLAISFFTLQQIAFLIDTYEGLAKEKNFIDYTIFVTFFPQLIAGPIVHHKEMMPQFATIRNKTIIYKNIALGLFVFSVGLFKKVVIADSFAVWASYGFDTATTLTLVEAWFTSLSFTFQIYFDFSAYTDMAIGIALLFNIKLPQNFNSPYKATSIIEFWQRWHMTLTNFISAYLYTPMLYSFQKITFFKAMVVTFLAFVIVGLWHGASWLFVLFGTLHGIATIINHLWRRTKVKINKFLAWFITFNFLNISLVVFRAKEWEDVTKIVKAMFVGNYTNVVFDSKQVVFMVLAFLVIIIFRNTIEMFDLKTFFKSNSIVLNLKMIYFLILFLSSVLYMSISTYSEFLYFNF